MLVGLFGYNLALGGTRFTFGSITLIEGIPVVPTLIGLFAFPEIIRLINQTTREKRLESATTSGALEGIREVLRRPGLVIRSSAIGTGLGIIPGVGGSITNWIAYGVASTSSNSPETFGEGNIEGVIAPEAANDSKDGGQLMPLLALGIPGGLTTALLGSAFLLKGVTPGRSMFDQDLSLVFVLILGLLFANLWSSSLGLLTSRLLVRVADIPRYQLFSGVAMFGLLGAYVSTITPFALLVAFVSGIVGYAFMRLGYSRAALVIGLILLPIVEDNFLISQQMYRGGFGFLARPLVLLWVLVTLLVFAGPRVKRFVDLRWRDGRTAVSEKPRSNTPHAESADADHAPRLEVVLLVSVLLVVGLMATQLPGMRFQELFVPLLVLGALTLVSVGRMSVVFREIRADDGSAPAGIMTAADLRAIGLLGLAAVAMWALGGFWTIVILGPAISLVVSYEEHGWDWRRFMRTALGFLALAYSVRWVLVDLLGYAFPRANIS